MHCWKNVGVYLNRDCIPFSFGRTILPRLCLFTFCRTSMEPWRMVEKSACNAWCRLGILCHQPLYHALFCWISCKLFKWFPSVLTGCTKCVIWLPASHILRLLCLSTTLSKAELITATRFLLIWLSRTYWPVSWSAYARIPKYMYVPVIACARAILDWLPAHNIISNRIESLACSLVVPRTTCPTSVVRYLTKLPVNLCALR